MYSCILLAAGQSERFGSPKALASLGSSLVIERQQNMLLESNISEVIVVLGAHDSLIRPCLLKHNIIRSVYNKDHNFGQTSSFQIGLKSVSKNTLGVLLLPVDTPFVKTDTINILINEFARSKPEMLIPTYKGRRGHPPIFSTDLSAQILTLDHNQGLNTISHTLKSVQELATEDPGIVQSFNTSEELRKLL